MDQNELINRLKQRDPEALKAAVENYSNLIYKVAIGFMHDQQAADDIVQDVFIKLWESAPKLNFDKTKLSTWLYRVTVNHCINQVKRQKFKSLFHDLSKFTRKNDDGAIEVEIHDNINLNPQQYTENQELGQIIQKAINSLPKKQRIAFILTKYRNMSAKQAAEIMDTSPANVDVLVHRAKKNLQKFILKNYKN